MTRLLICGGRDFQGVEYAVARLAELCQHHTIDLVINGAATGADTIGQCWAEEMGIPTLSLAAQWKRYGKKAGMMRNQLMLDEGNPDLVFALPGGRGTADMIARARQAGVDVLEYGSLLFRKEDRAFGRLSNFYISDQVDDGGVIWPTNEHYYQSRKTLIQRERDRVYAASTPNAAKKLGQRLTLRSDWEGVKRDEMLSGLRMKFAPDTRPASVLLSTHPDYLVEYAPWGDTYWGVNKELKGENWLGRLLCVVRDELRIK